jgi:hypothetical protein
MGAEIDLDLARPKWIDLGQSDVVGKAGALQGRISGVG